MPEPDLVDLRAYGKVLGTRSLGRRIVAEHPNVNTGLAVYLRVDGVRVISGSVQDEIIKAWPTATLAGASEDVTVHWNDYFEWRRELAADSGDGAS